VSSDDNGEDNGDHLPSPCAASLESQSNTTRSAGRRRMPPNIAPVARMVSHQSSIDDDQTELGAIDPEHTYTRSTQHTKQHEKAKKNGLEQPDARSAECYTSIPETGLGGLPFHTSSGILPMSHDPSEQSRFHTEPHIERPFFSGIPESSTKRSKISSTVHTPKPSLIVTLKLTPAKDALDQRRTMPPQQPYISMPSPELPLLDDIIGGRSMAPVDRQSDDAQSLPEGDDSDYKPPKIASDSHHLSSPSATPDTAMQLHPPLTTPSALGESSKGITQKADREGPAMSTPYGRSYVTSGLDRLQKRRHETKSTSSTSEKQTSKRRRHAGKVTPLTIPCLLSTRADECDRISTTQTRLSTKKLKSQMNRAFRGGSMIWPACRTRQQLMALRATSAQHENLIGLQTAYRYTMRSIQSRA
jgi:hypothetical protein